MNVTYDKLGDVEGKIAIELEAADYADKVNKEIKSVAKTRQEPGFRVGHTPIGLIQKKYGNAIKIDTINKMVSDELYKYITDNNIKVIGNPVPVKNDDFDIKADDFKFEFEVGIAPEITVKIDKDIHIPFYTIKVTDKMIDDKSVSLRRQFGKQEPGDTVNEDALVKGVITELNEDGSVKEDGIVQENGIVCPKYFKSEEQRELFAGKHTGDRVVFNPAATCDANPAELASMLAIDRKDADRHTGDFSFDIKEIFVLKPAELDEEYYKSLFGEDKVHNEEEYRNALRDMLANELIPDSNYRFSIDAREIITAAQGEMVLPERILKEYLKIQNEEVTDENIDTVYAEAVSGLDWQLIADHFAEEKGIKVEENDMRELARMMTRNQFAQYGMTNIPQSAIDKYADELLADEKTRRRIASQSFDMKVFAEIHNSVTLDNKEVDVEEFNALFKFPDEESGEQA